VNAEPQPRDDGAPEPVPASVAPGACPLCGAAVAPTDERCPACNLSLSGVGGRPGPFSRRVLWLWAAALLGVYLVALAVVALVPA
jgi:hypothetical protein